MTAKKEMEEMVETCQYFREKMRKGFDDLEKLKDSGNVTDADLDYELARDRKAGIVLKSIMIEMNIEKLGKRKINQIEK